MRMTYPLLTAFAALQLLVLCGSAWADPCDRLPPPSVTLKRIEEPVRLDTSYNHRSLTVLGSALARPRGRVLGLTRGTARVKIEIKTASLIDSTGRWECTSPQFVVSYGFSPLTVYVASEFPAGSCAYDEIYRHELRHVKTYQEHLIGIEQDLRETLTRRFATGSPWRGPVGRTQTMLGRELNERWIPYIKREIERVESAQARIDTPDEYARVARTCHGDLRRLTRQAD
jgi:hypothetical protein